MMYHFWNPEFEVATETNLYRMTATNIWYLIFGTDTARYFNFGALSKTLSSHFSWFFFFVIGGR